MNINMINLNFEETLIKTGFEWEIYFSTWFNNSIIIHILSILI